MARETDYTVLYKAAADFSALAREAAKAKAVLKAMREEEEKANKVSLQDQDRIARAREKARKALEAQNMAATVSARISREMADRGKKEAETVRELAKGSEAAARQITKLAEAYKKLNSAASGEGVASSSKQVGEKSSFAAITAKDLEQVRKNLAAYMSTAKETTDTNTRLTSSNNALKNSTSQVGDLLSRLSAATKKNTESITEVTVSTRNYGNVVETTTRRVQNAGTEAEKITTTIRTVNKEVKESSNIFVRWAANVAQNLGRTWREAEQGVSVFARLRRAMASTDSVSWSDRADRSLKFLDGLGKQASHVIGVLARLPRALQVAIGIAAIFEPAVAVLGALGAAALGAANNLAALSGVLAAVPGMIAAAGTAVAALFVAFSPVKGVLDQFKKAQLEQETASSRSAKAQSDNAAQIRAAVSGVRSAMNSLKSAQEGVVDANQRLGDANERLADSHKNLERAQQDVGRAAKDAKRELEDLRDVVRGAAEDQESAEIALARAREDQIRVNKDLTSSNLDKREAALRVRQAEDELRDVLERNKRNREDLTEAEKKGIKGSDQVVAANERVIQAERDVLEAQRGVADAQRGIAQARRRVIDAELDLADAKKRLAESYRTETSASAAATTQQDRYKKMLADLSPSTRKVVKDLLDLQGAWKGVQRNTSESFFSRIVGDMGLVRGMLPTVNMLLTDAADALGEVAHKGILMLSSGPWKADFKTLSKDNAVLIRNMGDAGLSVADAFRHITMAAAPFTRWVSVAIKDGAKNFADWSKEARRDGSIKRFLEDTKERMQQMWQVTKNVLATLNSWNTASNDFGKWMLDRVELMTKKWRENAKAQEENGSSLKKYLEGVRPVLTAVASLVGALAKGFADIASDPENMVATIKLLQTLENDVLPPLLRLLDELNEAGIAIVVAEALGKIFDAIATFLEGGGGMVLRAFVTSFSLFVGLLVQIYKMPILGDIIAYAAASFALLAGAVVAAKFVGLFKLIDMFKWVLSNGRNVAGRFRDIGDGINSTNTTNTTVTGPGAPGAPRGGAGRPSTGILPPSQQISSTVLGDVQRNVANYSKAASDATVKSGFFARSLDGVRNAAGGMRGGLSSLTEFLGGPWGAALAVATIGLTYFAVQQGKITSKASEYRSALESFGNGASSAADGVGKLTAEALKADPKLTEMVTQLQGLGLSAGEIEDAFNGSGDSVEKAIKKIDEAIEKAELNKQDYFLGDFIGDNTFNKDVVERINKYKALRKELEDNKITSEQAKKAAEELGLAHLISAEKTQTAADATSNLSDKTHAANFAQAAALEKSTGLEGVLKVLSDTTSTTSQRFDALKTATELLFGDQISATEASENFNRKLLELSESVKTNGKSLSEHSIEGLNNRDALQAAALAARDETLMLIASGVPYDEAIKKHKERIDKLKEEAGKSDLNTEKAGALIDQYSKIPPAKTTKVELEGFDAVYQHLRELQFAQWALSQGLTPEEAAAAWKRNEALMKGEWKNPRDNADKQKYAGGGAVFGPGSKTSDDIDAKLSNGEFVHKAAAVDYYGTDLLYALNNQMIDKNVLKVAAKASSVKGPLDFEYADGGLIQKYADGGSVWPFPVSMAGVAGQTRKLYNEWRENFAPSGDGGSVGAGGLRSGILGILMELRERFGKVPLISGLRKGSRTLSGNTSYHASGRAIDIAPIRAWAEYLKSEFGGRLKELITPWRDLNMWQGRPHRYSRAVEAQHGVFGSNAHIHAAYRDGGLVDLMNFNGLAMPNIQGVPKTNVSGLSQAAKSVVNNTNSGMSFGDVIIHNPVPERGGDSIRKSLMRTAMLFDGP